MRTPVWSSTTGLVRAPPIPSLHPHYLSLIVDLPIPTSPSPSPQGDGHQCEGSAESDHAGSPTPGEDPGGEAANVVVVTIVQRYNVMQCRKWPVFSVILHIFL